MDSLIDLELFKVRFCSCLRTSLHGKVEGTHIGRYVRLSGGDSSEIKYNNQHVY